MKLRKTFWIEYGIILIFTMISSLIRYSLWDKLELKGDFPLEVIPISFLFMVITWEFFRGMNSLLNQKLSYSKGLGKRIALQLILGAVFMLVGNRILFLLAGKYLEGSLSILFSMTTYATFTIMSFLINSVFFGKYFFDEWKKSLLKAERLEKEKTQVQFDNLKNQLNPHFLFNSLSSLHSLIYDNPGLASEYVTNLSKVYRYVLQHEEKNLVSLKEELDFIGQFIFLLETRFKEGIEITMQINQDQLSNCIAPVSLQVLLENCVKHNVIDPDQVLKIRLETQGEYLCVQNNKNPKVLAGNSNQMGLKQLTHLYSFLTDLPVKIEESKDSFSVFIPLISTKSSDS
ncbi:sensor histidine kinase [Algoriphagus hitonicola]|uniref:Histidine kinase n=1 Tax=Algoriphagus hitonicola TaxID=435880 RepID=A0A1I2XJ63_9BACT|nr:sensor histidine kinase [Algoriphagus hitonicola]SFH13533.1 Histidine kinase [Algoriphagus hitonicola]